jgi:hypothetical protein
MEETLEMTDNELQEAVEALPIAHENLEGARNIHKFSGDGVEAIKRHIKEIEELVVEKKAVLHPICEVPEEVWVEIFELIISSYEEAPTIRPNQIQALVLNDVCQLWRSIMQSDTSLDSQLHDVSWDTIDIVSIAAGPPQESIPFLSLLPRMTSLQTIEISGPEMDHILDTLLPQTATTYKRLSNIFRLPAGIQSLKKLIVTNYVGDGVRLSQFADRCHIWHYLSANKSAAATHANWMQRGCETAEDSRLLVLWYCRQRGFEVPKVSSSFYTIVREPKKGKKATKGIYYYSSTLRIPGMGDFNHYSQQYASTEAEALCWRDAATRLIQDVPKIWEEFLQDIRLGKDGPSGSFKVELRDCTISDDAVRRKLELYL